MSDAYLAKELEQEYQENYLSIDESFYSHEKKGTAHRCYKSLGSVETWIQKGTIYNATNAIIIPQKK